MEPSRTSIMSLKHRDTFQPWLKGRDLITTVNVVGRKWTLLAP